MRKILLAVIFAAGFLNLQAYFYKEHCYKIVFMEGRDCLVWTKSLGMNYFSYSPSDFFLQKDRPLNAIFNFCDPALGEKTMASVVANGCEIHLRDYHQKNTNWYAYGMDGEIRFKDVVEIENVY